jgi:agmatinase
MARDQLPNPIEIAGTTPVLNTFLGAPTDVAEAKYVVVGVPFDRTSSFRRGSRRGPAAIRTASQNIESFCLIEGANLDAASLPIADIGDVTVKRDTVEGVLRSLESVVTRLLPTRRAVIVLGGEHSITLGAVRALGSDSSLIQFDAHMDLRDTFGGTAFSHACVARRVVELLGPDHLIQVGIRAVSKEEYEFAEAKGILRYTVQEVERYGAPAIAHRILESLPRRQSIYLSVDMDVLDPAFAPAVGNPEPGGLTSLQLLALLRVLAFRATALDVTEVAPQYDQGLTALCAARIVTTFLCAKSTQPR